MIRMVAGMVMGLVCATVAVGQTTATTQAAPAVERRPGTALRIVLVGDSTVTDKAGWGAAFGKLLRADVECINTARGGRSSMSFIKEGSWAKALALKGDYILIQFGHNDQKIDDPNRGTDVRTGYPMYLKQYVDEARGAGATPILVTPMTRRQFQADGRIKSGLTEWAEQVKKVAAEKDVPVVDLHARSIELFEAMGKERCDQIAPRKENGDIDGTHLTEASAVLIAPLVAKELKSVVPESKEWFK